MIIGLDLLIVLGVYFLYVNFMGPGDKTVKKLQGPVTYSFRAERNTSDKIAIELRVRNTTDTEREVTFPNGIRFQLSDGTRVIYWHENLYPENQVTFERGESRSWSLTAPNPKNPPETLYAEFIIDEDRQARLAVPGE